jgi:hypothetical protein
MLTILTAAVLAAAPAPKPAADPHAAHRTTTAEASKAAPPCDMPCCKDKPMPCCEKMHGEKKAEAPVTQGHGEHEHDH